MVVDDGDTLRDELLDISEVLFLFSITEGDSDTTSTCPACASDAVDIGLGDIRELEIDDMRELIDIDPTCRDIGRDEDTDFFVLESCECCLAIILGFIAMDSFRWYTCEIEVFHDFIGSMFCPREDKYSLNIFIFQDIFEEVLLIVLIDEVHALTDHMSRTRWRSDFDFRRIGEDISGEVDYSRRHGRREEERLSLARKLGDDLLHIMDESHIEHTICLIEYEEFDLPKIDESLLHEIEQSTWSRDQDIDPFWERIDLTMLAHTSEYHLRSEVRIASIVCEALFDLDRELSCRSEDECTDRTSPRDFPILLVHELDYRKGERCRLPGPCLCDSEKVSSCEDKGYRFLLYGSRLSISFLGEGF